MDAIAIVLSIGASIVCLTTIFWVESQIKFLIWWLERLENVKKDKEDRFGIRKIPP